MKYPSFHWSKVILLASFLTVFISFSIRSGFGILLPEIMDALALTKAQAGYIGSAYFVAYMFFSPLLGILTDKIGGEKGDNYLLHYNGGWNSTNGHDHPLVDGLSVPFHRGSWGSSMLGASLGLAPEMV